MIKIDNISCVIIAKDAQATIKEVLDALKYFSDVVVYSNNSTDKTDEIAKSYENINLIQGEFLGFGPTKNKASEYAKNDWILSLDADEVLSEEFIYTLNKKKLKNDLVYSILRINYYKKSKVRHCWGDDVLVRIYNRTKTSFTNKKVHEKVITQNFKIESIRGNIRHYPYSNISEFIIKLDRYSSYYAQENAGKKDSSPLKASLNAMYSFNKTYFAKFGFLDGYAGLIIAFSHMATNFYKYMKLYELNKELKSR